MKAKSLITTTSLVLFCGATSLLAQADRVAQVRNAVSEFYRDFDEGFMQPASCATEDWYHINPYGGVDKGRDATLKTVRHVHQTFPKGRRIGSETSMCVSPQTMLRWRLSRAR